MNRVAYLDQAKAWGMFLIYYGHFLEALLRAGGVAAFAQWKLIYTFHLPFFFFLTGAFWKPGSEVAQVVKVKLKTRLLPVATFGLLLVPAWLCVRPPLAVLAAMGRYASGKTDLNAITWFLVCLFVVEVLAAVPGRYFRLGPWQLLVCALLAYCLGMLAIAHDRAIAHYTGVVEGFWYINEAVVALSFYLIGYALRGFILAPERIPAIARVAILVVSGFVLLTTYDLNQGPFPNKVLKGVVMNISSHGNPFYFALTAYAGIFTFLALMWFGRRVFGWTEFVGRNSLIFLGLNGINLHFLDRWVVEHSGYLPGTAFEVVLFAGGYTLMSLLVFCFLAAGLRRWVPELVGYHWHERSLLPPMAVWWQQGFGARLAGLARKLVLK